MKLYTSVGPNPNVVRMFVAEKGIKIPTQEIDIIAGENRQEPYISKVNTRGQSPALETDSGSHISEITAICEYLEELHPTPALIGTNAEERAETRMWVRRIDQGICEPMGNGFRASEGYDMFKDRIRVLPEAADGLKAIAQDNLAWLNNDLGSRQFVCGDRFTLADILLFGFIDFGNKVNQPLNAEHSNLTSWLERMSQRASANP
ncbi:glutathione S-transferase [Chromatiales bacterium (ex Bugula neritina AB1)]|nr:glutathione S-transferase [Chromatiales bacterium (ex Bugula neritina AB1)]